LIFRFVLARSYLDPNNQRRIACFAMQHGSGGARRDAAMSPQRFATLGAFGGTVVLAGWVVAGLAGFGSPGIENTDRAPIEERRATPLTVGAEPASALRANTIINKTSAPSAAVAATEPG
jgi:hypothetical protein